MITSTPTALASSQRQTKHVAAASTTTSRVPSRPTTPLRSASRTSLRAAQTTPSDNNTANAYGSKTSDTAPLQRLEPAFAELSDGMADLEANFMHLQLLNESIARFNENFAAFLYGLNMTAFCVDFPEAPIPQSFDRHGSNTCQMDDSPFRDLQSRPAEGTNNGGNDTAPDATFMTGDTSFVENPPMSTKPASKTSTSQHVRRGAAAATAASRGGASTRGKVPVAGVDAHGRRTTRLPSGASRGTVRGSAARGGGAVNR